MKRSKLILILLASLSLTATGCEDFLETQPSTQVSDQVLLKEVDGVQTVLNGVYRYIRRGNSVDPEYGGIFSFQSGFDASANDIVVDENGARMQIFYGHHQNQTRAESALTRHVWQNFYTIINNTNIILESIDGATGHQDQKDAVKGQALALRAWSYFYLVRLYQHTYSIAKDMPGVPYYSSPDKEGKPREKVSVVYQHIVDDLTSSVELLGGYNRQFKSQVNRAVAQGMLAEVYLTMEEWEKAAAAAREARTGYPLMTGAEYQSGFNNWNTGEWMWGVEQTDEQGFGLASPFALWANNSRQTFSWSNYFVNDRFKNLFGSADVRNQFWQRPDRNNLWTSDKFRDNAASQGDVVLMRAAEMHLIEAEALARMGNFATAKDVLWALQDARNAMRSTTDGPELVAEILVERRKELYGEGFAWFDLLRNQLPVKREGDHLMKPEIPARSWKFIFQIPTSEFTTNTSLTAQDQNPYEGTY